MRLRNFIFCMIDATWPWSSDPHISRQISYAGKSKADEMYILLKIWIYLCTYMYLGVDGNCAKVAWFYKLG